MYQFQLMKKENKSTKHLNLYLCLQKAQLSKSFPSIYEVSGHVWPMNKLNKAKTKYMNANSQYRWQRNIDKYEV